MCGIVAVLPRPSLREAPDPVLVTDQLTRVVQLLGSATDPVRGLGELRLAAELLGQAERALGYTPGLRCLIGNPGLLEDLAGAASRIGKLIVGLDGWLDVPSQRVEPSMQEQVNAALIALKDSWWALERDRLGAARSIVDLSGSSLPEGSLQGWWAIHVALSSLDRLEVRGRDSAGLYVLVAGHGLELGDRQTAEHIARRSGDPLFGAGSLRVHEGAVSFVYKAAAEIGELGDNVRELRAQIRSDGLLHEALAAPGARVVVIGHTRWASVGIISEANAHPVDSEEPGRAGTPYVVAALNGDVDNHIELRRAESIETPRALTTDAKVIPTMVSRVMAQGVDADEAFRSAVSRLEGSVAIAASVASRPDSLHLAVRGSGQSLYIGLAEDSFVVASEPYGLVEETSRYLRMDGDATRGQLVVLERSDAGTLEGVSRLRYDGTPLPVSEEEVSTAEITTRDVDRGGFPHFLLKELTEAPASFRKTLRGRLVEDPAGRLTVRVGRDTLSPDLIKALKAGEVTKVAVVGQGTAAVAGQAVAEAIRWCLPFLSVSAQPATELSGFGMKDDMTDTLLVAISQSGTTTDTNRTVDLVRARGAHVIAIVNRRNSDLVSKAHGVLYTSDGRDVEMSVASTKAFYAQVAAGWILAGALMGSLEEPGGTVPEHLQGALAALRDLPAAMEKVLSEREEIGKVASAVAPARRHWAVVGSGPDRIAAAEVRIKLSELCYRSIASDATEDKKHIDLSCEPLVVVCGAALHGPNAGDVAKEVAIYRAHKACPVVIVPEGEQHRFEASAQHVITVPPIDPRLAFVLAAMAGHLFGYEAALAIDAQARPLRTARAAIERAVTAAEEDSLLERLRPDLEEAAGSFLAGLAAGSYNGNLEASTAVRLASLLRYAIGALPLEAYEAESGKIGSPAVLLSDLLDALNAGIDELTRPVDAIKHQAKTVTVGISRSEEALFGVPLVKATLGAGAAPDALGYRALRTLAALDEAVEEVTGFTRYQVDWGAMGGPTARVVSQGGIALGIPSRTEADPRLRGTKHRAAEEREVTVARGASDGRTVILVPEAHGNQVDGLTLLHVRFRDRLDVEAARRVLLGYRTRLSALSDAVTETEAFFDEERLATEPVVDLLTEPVYVLAARWRSGGEHQ